MNLVNHEPVCTQKEDESSFEIATGHHHKKQPSTNVRKSYHVLSTHAEAVFLKPLSVILLNNRDNRLPEYSVY